MSQYTQHKLAYDQHYERLAPTPISIVDSKQHTMMMHIENKLIGNAIVEMHWHDWVEILYIVRGQTTVYTEFETVEVTTGNVVVIGSSTPHRLVVEQGDHYTQCFHIHAGLLVDYQCLDVFSGNLLLVKDTSDIIPKLHILANNMGERMIKNQLIHDATLLQLVASLLEEYDVKQSKIAQISGNGIIDKMCTYTQENYHKNLSLSSISETFGYTKQYVAAMFKKEKDFTFTDYLNAIRVRKAKYNLMNSEESILNIGFECGYSSEHAFIRNFKKIVGKTPREYRIDKRAEFAKYL